MALAVVAVVEDHQLAAPVAEERLLEELAAEARHHLAALEALVVEARRQAASVAAHLPWEEPVELGVAPVDHQLVPPVALEAQGQPVVELVELLACQAAVVLEPLALQTVLVVRREPASL